MKKKKNKLKLSKKARVYANAVLFVKDWEYCVNGSFLKIEKGSIIYVGVCAYFLHTGGLALPNFYGPGVGEYTPSSFFVPVYIEQ